MDEVVGRKEDGNCVVDGATIVGDSWLVLSGLVDPFVVEGGGVVKGA
jgi:hypothetical protein